MHDLADGRLRDATVNEFEFDSRCPIVHRYRARYSVDRGDSQKVSVSSGRTACRGRQLADERVGKTLSLGCDAVNVAGTRNWGRTWVGKRRTQLSQLTRQSKHQANDWTDQSQSGKGRHLLAALSQPDHEGLLGVQAVFRLVPNDTLSAINNLG